MSNIFYKKLFKYTALKIYLRQQFSSTYHTLRFRKSLAQKRFKSNMEIRYQIIVSAIKNPSFLLHRLGASILLFTTPASPTKSGIYLHSVPLTSCLMIMRHVLEFLARRIRIYLRFYPGIENLISPMLSLPRTSSNIIM